jgi:hypothetical protein
VKCDLTAVDLANSCTAMGRTRLIATSINFLREVKDQGIISVQWISNVSMSSDIFTKNVGGRAFLRHRDVYVPEDPSVSQMAASTRPIQLERGWSPHAFERVEIVRNWIEHQRTRLEEYQ